MEKETITISQCMIVKNEESNIRRALSWGKEIMSEQIVVDTGSEDRTAEIAGKLGAAVYHFDWNHDFSQAKNFAIEQAKGDWIVFLDADEYIKPEEAKKLEQLIREMSKNGPQGGGPCHIIRARLANLDESGRVFSLFRQDRIFRNLPFLRYQGAIHEIITAVDQSEIYFFDAGSRFTIYHTGYQKTVFSSKEKAERNVELLKIQLNKEPGNYNLMSYLADSLDAAKRWEEAAVYDQQVVANRNSKVKPDRIIASFYRLIRNLAVDPRPESGIKLHMLYEDAVACAPDYPDFDYLAGIWMMKHDRWPECAFHMENALTKAESYRGSYSTHVESNYASICYWIAYSAYQDQMTNRAIKYLVLSLRADRYYDYSLRLLLKIFHENTTPCNEVLEFLLKLYEKNSLKDKLFLIKNGKEEYWQEWEQTVYGLLTREDRDNLERLDTNGALENLEELPVAFLIQNRIDELFELLMKQLFTFTQEKISALMKKSLMKLKNEDGDKYSVLLRFLNSRPEFYGRLKPDTKDYGAIERRAGFLHSQRDDLLWIYGRLGDYRSKKTLLAILSNLLYINRKLLEEAADHNTCYCDPDLVPTDNGGVFVDVGAYTGDTLYSYIQSYGKNYQKIYCYEIAHSVESQLRKMAAGLENVEIRMKGAYSQDGQRYLREDGAGDVYADLNGDSGFLIDTVRIDEDVREAVTFLKISAPGSELEALQGSEGQILKNRPQLAINVSYSYDSFVSVFKWLSEKAPFYRFYLRYYGGSLVPTDYVLYAVAER